MRENKAALVEFLLLQDGIDLDAETVTGLTPLALARAKGAAESEVLLAKAGAKPVMSPMLDYEYIHLSVVVIVTGIEDEEMKVVLGKSLSPSTGLDKAWKFPGGMRDAGDENDVATALRELREETHLDIESWQDHPEVTIEIVYQHHYTDTKTFSRTTFVHINLGNALPGVLKATPIIALDDLMVARCLPCVRFRAEPDVRSPETLHFSIDDMPIVSSNGFVLSHIINKVELDKKHMKFLCDVALHPNAVLKSAIKVNDVACLKRLRALGVSLDQRIYVDGSILGVSVLGFACQSQGSADVVKYLFDVLAGQDSTLQIQYALQACYAVLSTLSKVTPEKRDYGLLDFFLRTYPACINASLEGDDCLLSEATRLELDHVVDMLLDLGALVNVDISVGAYDSKTYSPLQRAVMAGRGDLVNRYLMLGADVNQCFPDVEVGEMALFNAAASMMPLQLGASAGSMSRMMMHRWCAEVLEPRSGHPLVLAMHCRCEEAQAALRECPELNASLAFEHIKEWMTENSMDELAPKENETLQIVKARMEAAAATCRSGLL